MNNIEERIEKTTQKRIADIRAYADMLKISGNTYYVSNDGNDENDGLSPETAWKSLDKVSFAALCAGDGVLFKRGDLFRGTVKTRAGISYGAYGNGEKPRFYGWDKDLADPSLWEIADAEHSIWHCKEKILDVGTLVFDHGKAHSRKLIPSYADGKFVCRDDESRLFVMAEEMTRDLDLYWHYDERLTTTPSKNLSFPIPIVDDQSFGDLFLRSDRGNPALCFDSIEALTKRPMFLVGGNADVKIDNLCMKYIGHHAVCAGGHVKGLHVTNCEIGWIGGTIQHYFGTDPNYPQGSRGSVTRFGNAIEIYGGCEDYLVENCYIYQVYDAGITHQITTWGKEYSLSDIKYLNNVVEDCVYAIEYFLEMNEGDTTSIMKNILISKNILRRSGYGWGQQRHNVNTPALIKGWSYENRATDFLIEDNIFDRSAYRMLHLVAKEPESCPVMSKNIYVQHRGGMLGQYGANAKKEPPIMLFDDNIEQTVKEQFGDSEAQIYFLD
ncbi:MAG: hypothetical protein E7642_04740 [Ruminococcaceae bacterium]|nr:hypothetical protein [Oscillospiraceae bacterium]